MLSVFFTTIRRSLDNFLTILSSLSSQGSEERDTSYFRAGMEDRDLSINSRTRAPGREEWLYCDVQLLQSTYFGLQFSPFFCQRKKKNGEMRRELFFFHLQLQVFSGFRVSTELMQGCIRKSKIKQQKWGTHYLFAISFSLMNPSQSTFIPPPFRVFCQQLCEFCQVFKFFSHYYSWREYGEKFLLHLFHLEQSSFHYLHLLCLY